MTIKTALFLLIIIALLSSCSDKTNSVASFSGEADAVNLADSMFLAIGGKQAWCELQSLYIKAEHTEPQMTQAYQSEIWRSMEDFDVIIEQQNDSFHVRAVFNDSLAKVTYLDHRDTFRILSDEQITNWRFSNAHNVYVLLHDFACDPDEYTVKNDDRQLIFLKDSITLCKFGLDEDLRPHLFYAPDQKGKLNGSIFTHWATDNGLVHSAGGHPLDSNFIYRTEEWIPAYGSLRESFEISEDE